MLAQSEGAAPPVRRKKGDKLAVPVVALNDDWVFVSLGGKEEGTIRREEFAPPGAEASEAEKRAPLPAVGDTVEAYVLSACGGEVVLTTQLGGRDASLASIEQAAAAGIPVEGTVARTVKGGFEVRVSSVRAFCPLSQIDLRWPKEPTLYLEQTFRFRILEFKENGRNIVLSRRSLLEEEREKQKEALRETLQPGAVVSGRVRSVQKFGAFVDLGGVDALIPISEMAWSRVEDPTEVVAEGQQVTAQVLQVDWDRERISLSLKALGKDPWEEVAGRFPAGSRVQGRVARLANFGAFVTLEPGVDGLVHISAMGAGRRINHPKEVVAVGDEVEVEVVSADAAKRKISLSMEHRYRDSLGSLPRAGDTLDGAVEKVAEFGVFVKLPSGHTGLVPNVEMATERGADHKRMFQPGNAMEVAVLGVEEGGRRIRLSRKALIRREERAAAAAYAPPADGGGFGTLGDLLKAKLKDQ
jgi:small subunit ribosomal protein S1